MRLNEISLAGEKKAVEAKSLQHYNISGLNRGREANKGDRERAAGEIKGKRSKCATKARQRAYL